FRLLWRITRSELTSRYAGSIFSPPEAEDRSGIPRGQFTARNPPEQPEMRAEILPGMIDTRQFHFMGLCRSTYVAISAPVMRSADRPSPYRRGLVVAGRNDATASTIASVRAPARVFQPV